jgi:hypothetical protein
MLMHAFPQLVVAITITCVSVAAQCAQATTGNNGRDDRILFARQITAPIGGEIADYFPSSVALYVVDQDGAHVQQLTPQQEGRYFLSGLESDTTLWGYGPVHWLAKNFSSDGTHILYFDGLSSQFPAGQDSMSGKYRIMDTSGQSRALFPGPDDVNARYGFVTWGPPGSDEIAYTNSAENYPASSPCVFLIHPDGSGAHPLWCAELHETPTSVSNLRWSGDGRSLLAYVNWGAEYETPPNWGFYSNTELWRISVATGAAARVVANINQPALSDSADISYDGNKVIYEGVIPYESDSPECDPETVVDGIGYAVCVLDITTGQTTVISDYGNNGNADLQLLIGPGGKRAIFNRYNNPAGSTGSESDIYLASTADGSVIRELTRRPHAGLPDRSVVVWKAVAWSSDGKRLLVNRYYYAPPVPNTITQPVSDIYVINTGNGKARHLLRGHAEGWYQPLQ